MPTYDSTVLTSGNNAHTNTSGSSYAAMTWSVACATYVEIQSVAINLNVSDTYTLSINGTNVASVTGNGAKTFTLGTPVELAPGHHTFKITPTASRVWNYAFGGLQATGTGSHLLAFCTWDEVGNQTVPATINFKAATGTLYSQLGSQTSTTTSSYTDYTFTITLSEAVTFLGHIGFVGSPHVSHTLRIDGNIVDTGKCGWGASSGLSLAAGSHTIRMTPASAADKRYIGNNTDSGTGANKVTWGLWQEPGNQYPVGSFVFQLPASAPQVTANLTGSGAFSAMAGPVIADDFNRADSPSSLGSTSVANVAWEALAGTWGINSNRAVLTQGVSALTCFAVVQSGVSDGAVYTVIGTDAGASNSGLIVRAVSNGNGIVIEGGNGSTTAKIYRGVAGSYTVIGQSAGNVHFGAGDVIRAVLAGQTITVFRNGVEIMSATDSTYQTATKHGLYTLADASSGGVVTFDSFGIPSLVEVVPVAAALAGSGDFSATVVEVEVRTAAWTGTGDFSATVVPVGAVDANLTGTGDFSATVTSEGVFQVAADLVGSGDFSATAVLAVAAALTGSGDFSATVTSEIVYPAYLLVLTPTVEQPPSTVTVAMANLEPLTEVTFEIDDVVVGTEFSDINGDIAEIVLPVDRQFLAGEHTVTGSTATRTASGTFEVLLSADALPAVQAPDAPAELVPEAVTKWVFQDLMPGGIGTWVMPVNPSTMGNPHVRKTVATVSTTAVSGIPHVSEGATPVEWEFAGFAPDQAFQDKLIAYSQLPYRFYIIDHRNRAWVVAIARLSIVPRKRVKDDQGNSSDWLADYTVSVALFSQSPQELA